MAHLFNHIRPFLLPAPRLGGDRKIGNNLYSVFKKERNVKYIKSTAGNTGNIKCQSHSLAGFMLLDHFHRLMR